MGKYLPIAFDAKPINIARQSWQLCRSGKVGKMGFRNIFRCWLMHFGNLSFLHAADHITVVAVREQHCVRVRKRPRKFNEV